MDAFRDSQLRRIHSYASFQGKRIYLGVAKNIVGPTIFDDFYYRGKKIQFIHIEIDLSGSTPELPV